MAELIRKSFGLKEEIRPELEASYSSGLIDEMKAGGFQLQSGRLKIRLAEEFGFCYGVDRAIDYAYQTRMKFPDRRIFLTNEIIHNPQVNNKLRDMDVQFLSGSYSTGSKFADIQKEDVVIIPAFGSTMKELEELQKKGCTLVDTTCGSVMSVWKRVNAYAQDDFTSIIHGKYDHEETQATSSVALSKGGEYLVVRDKEQAQRVCDYIEGKGSRDQFMEEFSPACSEGFDPDKDLIRVGCANQTTMLSSESLEIANMLQDSMMRRYGKEELAKHFRHFDTICSATQERQDAVLKLVKENIDLMIVVGGFNSSNTGHLAEISSEYCPAFHINGPACLVSKDKISYKKVFSSEMVEAKNWLPEGDITLGVTAGASTPNRVVEDVIKRILELAQ